jgi:hypothetical protein
MVLYVAAIWPQKANPFCRSMGQQSVLTTCAPTNVQTHKCSLLTKSVKA